MLYSKDMNIKCLLTTVFRKRCGRKDVGQQVLVNNVEVIRTR